MYISSVLLNGVPNLLLNRPELKSISSGLTTSYKTAEIPSDRVILNHSSKQKRPVLLFAGENNKEPVKDILRDMWPEQRAVVQQYGAKYKAFLKEAVCAPFTVRTIIREAKKCGFKPFPKGNGNKKPVVKPGEKYYFNNGQSVALVVIGKDNPIKSGFNITGAHVDTPQLILKPDSIDEKKNIVTLRTTFHGSGQWDTWRDRDLGIAGILWENVSDKDGRPKLDPKTHLPKEKARYVRIDSPAVPIPGLAIHLWPRDKDSKGSPSFKIEKDGALAGISTVNGDKVYDTVAENVTASLKAKGIDFSKVSRAQLFLFPIEPPNDKMLVGNSMIAGYGQDDHSLCYASMRALFEASQSDQALKKTSIAYFFDHEETGSSGRGGARSMWVPGIISNIVEAQLPELERDLTQAREEALGKSLLLSADVTHGWLPQHEEHFDKKAHLIGQGPVIMVTTNDKLGTTPKGSAIVQDIAKRHDIPVQISVEKAAPGGSTIGVGLESLLNIESSELGISTTSMHSARESTAKVDGYLAKELMKHFFRND